jgi:CheY-like chemotaxis protein
VRDTGQGISPEFLPDVFDRFRQADGSTTRRHGGLGLGLSIARQIVEMHGGSIRAHSEGPGMGAVFTLTLPLAPASEAPQRAVPPARLLDLAGQRILVVDDDEDARELLRRLLVDRGCQVVCASSAEEALASLEGDACDIMLTDIGMPGTDGYELLQRVRASRHAELNVIAVTAFARPEDRERTRAAGFDGYVAKPIDPAHLLQTIARLA